MNLTVHPLILWSFVSSSSASKVTGRNQGYQSTLESVDASLKKFGFGKRRSVFLSITSYFAATVGMG